MKAYLVLENGSIYEGTPKGAFRETVCEIVFNNSMTGYFELITDPSSAGQGIVMTYPMIGNYGVNREDFESPNIHCAALIVNELSDKTSNFRCEQPLEDILLEFNIPCVSNIDTRAVVKKIRENGTALGVITEDISDLSRLNDLMKNYKQNKPVESVSTKEPFEAGTENTGFSVAVLDLGTKKYLLDALLDRGCRLTVYPHSASVADIISAGHDGVMISGGPGNPNEYPEIVGRIKELVDKNIPVFATGLGHQLVALSAGAKVQKMKHGHRGGNYPVKYIDDDQTYITAQNHGYEVAAESLPENIKVESVNVNDNTVEGLALVGKPVFTAQFYPDTTGSTHNTSFLFKRFIAMMEEGGCHD